MGNILEVHNLFKRYPGVTAVDGISFEIPSGICFGLLGPNGAGKTTTIEIIEGIIPATSGKILYKGALRGQTFKQEIGIQFQSTSLLHFLTVKESLETFLGLYRKTLPLDEVIATCYLEDILHQKNDKISGGQKQRLLLAMALLNDPDLIFLDEPTTGLDPQARRHLWDIVEKIKSKGKTVVLTTHYMEEAQILCDEIIIIDKGKIILQGAPENLLRNHCTGVTITLPRSAVQPMITKDTAHCLADCMTVNMFENSKTYEFMTESVNDCLNTLMMQGIDLSHMTLRTQNLEDLFLKLTGRQLRR